MPPISTVQVLENIKNALAAVGATFDHIKFNVYMRDLEISLPIFSEIKAQQERAAGQHPVQVSKLTRGACSRSR